MKIWMNILVILKCIENMFSSNVDFRLLKSYYTNVLMNEVNTWMKELKI